MSDFGLFEAATDAEQAPRRRERIAARQMTAALSEIHRTFGTFMANADGSDNFEDRWLTSKKDIFRILQANGVGQYPAVVREVHGSLKSAWYARHAAFDDDDDDETKPPKDDKDRDWTITDKQREKVEKGEKTDKDDVESNKVKDARRRYAGEDNFDEEADDSLNSDFTGGGDSGSDSPGGKEGRRHRADMPGTPLPSANGSMGAMGLGDTSGGGLTQTDNSALSRIEMGHPGMSAWAGQGEHEGSRRRADFSDHEDQAHPNQDLVQGREVSDALLVPDPVNDPSNPETGGVQNDFTPGGDTGSDGHREAMQLVADLYTDWAQGNNLRVASMNTLDVYAASGLHDDDYYLLAKLIRKAECDCDDDDKDDDHGHDDGPPSHDSEDSDDDSGDSESDDGGDDSGSDDSDSGDSESDSGDNPFAENGGGEEAPADDAGGSPDDGGNPFADDSAPDDAEAPGGDVPPGADSGPPTDPAEDPSAAGAPDVGGQDFTVPEEAPPLPPDMQEQIPPDDTQGDQAIPPEVIDQILGLPPGTLEQLVMEELSGGGDAPPSGPPPGGPPPQLAARRRRAAEDPTQAAGADPAAAAQPQMPAAPPAGAGSAGTIPPPGSASVPPPPPAMPLENQPAEDALLDTALQSITQMIDQETQEYQQMIDPLTKALQAVEFAQQVETAENPLDVTPPEGTVDVNPSAAPGGADSLPKQARTARINSIAKCYKLTRHAKYLMYEAMSRKHYEHVGEAIRTLPPELRGGIASHIGGMFKEDNPRFNNDKWMESVGAPRTASRRPFVIRSRTLNGGRTAGENLTNTPTLDAFEFPGQGAQKNTPRITDNNPTDDLPKIKGASLDREAKGVLDLFDDYTKKRTDQGLNQGPAANIDAFEQENGEKVGPQALTKLKKTITTNQHSASFFNRRVPGWKWDDHLAGYVSKEARPFTCSCGDQLSTPSYSTCRCGKIWNSYAVGDGNHLASNTADFFIAREIPVRDDVIVANRQMVADDRGYENFDAYGKGDTDWVEDKDREDADAPHAPGQTASLKHGCYPGCHEDEEHSKKFHKSDEDDDKKTAGLNDAMSLYERHFNTGLALGLDPNSAHERAVQNAQQAHQKWQPPPQMAPVGPDNNDLGPGTSMQAPSLKDKVRDHLLQRMQNGGFAGGRSANQQFFAESVTDNHDGWVKYDDEDPSRQGGPKKPPSTKVKGGDPQWHKREPAGQFKSTSPFKG